MIKIRKDDAFYDRTTGRVCLVISADALEVRTVQDGDSRTYSYGPRFFLRLVKEGRLIACEAPFL